MMRLRKQALAAGITMLLISVSLFAYACYGESDMRGRAGAPSGTDFGFIPFDLLEGRTHFVCKIRETNYRTERDDGTGVHTKKAEGVYSLDAGPLAEGRIAIARAALGVGILGAWFFLFGAFLRLKRKVIAKQNDNR